MTKFWSDSTVTFSFKQSIWNSDPFNRLSMEESKDNLV